LDEEGTVTTQSATLFVCLEAWVMGMFSFVVFFQ
jgi:hypothetical protein